ncbi:MAG TPA: ABC transporter permease [Ktedonobacteraceae bacterium]
MHIRAIIAIARKDAIDIILNKSMLFTLLSPLFVAAIYLIMGNIMATSPSKLLIYNPSNSPVQQIAGSFFQHSEVVPASSASEVAAAFGPNGAHKSSQYTMGLVIPPDFEAQIQQGKHPQLQLYANGNQMSGNNIQAMSNLLAEYASSVAAPHPLQLSLVTINPPSNTSVLDLLSTTFITAALLMSLLVGTSIMPHLLIEEKEKKTLRMLMVSPASFIDVVLGKLLVVLGYQLLLSCAAIAILQGFFGNVPVLILFALLGVSFALSLGLFAGGLFQSNGALSGFTSIVSFVLVLPGVIVGLAPLIGNNSPILQILKILPTYYIAQGAYDALNNQSSLNSILFNGGIVLAWTIILCFGAVYALRRQAQVVGTI